MMLLAEMKTWFQNKIQNQSSLNSFTGQFFFDEPLSRYTYYRIGGPAAFLAIPTQAQDIQWLYECIHETKVPFFILGKGSNVLIADDGFKGLMICTHRLNREIQFLSSSLRLRTGSSVAVTTLLNQAIKNGWAGLEFLAGIPGLVGGAIRMNAGTHLGETKDRLCSVQAFLLTDWHATGLKSVTYQSETLSFAYRQNLFLPLGGLIWAADWKIDLVNPMQVKTQVEEILKRRKETQPLQHPSCGSVFKNPKETGKSAWQVIDQLGLRGYQIGSAQFSEKHSNFIVNLGQAKASEVLELIQLAKMRAKNELGILLEEEVMIL